MKKSLVISFFCLMGILSAQAKTAVTQCEFSGFANHITYGMTWNQAALDALMNDFLPSANNAVYHLSASNDCLKKYNGIYGETVGLGTELGEGEYYFWAKVVINDNAKANYEFVSSNIPTVTVDGVNWTARSSSSTDISIESPHFRLEQASPEEMQQAEEALANWMEIAYFAATKLQQTGETTAANELSAVVSQASVVYNNENHTVSQLNAEQQNIQNTVDKYADKISLALKEYAKSIMDEWLDADDSEASKKIIEDAKAEIDNLPNQTTAIGILGVLIQSIQDTLEDAEKKLDDQRATEMTQLKKELDDYIDIAEAFALYKSQNGDATKAAEIMLAVDAAEDVLDDEYASLSDVKEQIAILDNLVAADTDELLAALKLAFSYEWTLAIDMVDDETCKQVLQNAINTINSLTWDKSKSVIENYKILDKAYEIQVGQVEEFMEDGCELQAIDSVSAKFGRSRKLIRNGQLIIERNNQFFNAQGQTL